MRIFTIGSLIQWICLIVLGNAQPWTTYRREDLDDLESFTGCCNETNCQTDGKPNYYRYIEPSIRDSSKIYVGAMNFLFVLDTTTMACTNRKYMPPGVDLKDRCARQGKSDIPDCQNHIREVFEINNQLEVCGTGAYQPQMYYLNALDLELQAQSLEANTSGNPQTAPTCPYDPLDNSTLLYSQEKNPGDTAAKYFGYYTDFTKNFPVFLRPKYTHNGVTYVEKLTDTEDVSWLNSPQFVGSFDIDNMVIIFFRETAVEYAETKKVYSRIAKVCKKDLGGGSIDVVRKKWLSFQKARLICSLPGKQPYYFDDIYDVAYDSENHNFYALFYKQGAALNASAICVYNMTQIREAFQGHFMHKNGTIVSPDPDPRLDNCTIHDTNPDIFRGKSSQYQLMSTKVQPVSGKPIFYKHGEQLLRLALSPNRGSYHNIYIGTSKGEVYDIFVNQADWTSHINTVMMPFTNSTPIWKMLRKDSALILGTDYSVTKIPLDNCGRIMNSRLDECVQNTYCQLEICETTQTKNCVSISGNISNECSAINAATISSGTMVRKYIIDDLLDAVKSKELGVAPDQTIELPIYYSVRLSNVHWKRSGQILTDPRKYGFSEHNLIIKNFGAGDNGAYEAFDELGTKVAIWNATVLETNEDTIQAWKRSFTEWSKEFNRWKSCSQTYINTCSSP